MKNSKDFYSNCLFEAIKAKIKNPKIKIMYLPVFLNKVPCPHWMWLDEEGEHDFHYKGYLPWWKWIWHKGHIRTVHRGCYKGCIDQMIEKKYYKGEKQNGN
jgi:hypothetical protein|uniref:Uncharacterized protein n=1 Tax=Bacteriophage sp. TaxID=38018 RepID=A0A8D9PEN8_9VIRU|nr:MAG TPA: hypothetical protein [Bacteriophage sp.]